MRVIIDTSTIQQMMSGTGYYTFGMLRELAEMNSVESVTALGGDPDIINSLQSGKIRFHFPKENNWHKMINLRLLANQPNLKADIALFPNYFMPPGLSIPSVVTVHDLSFISHPHLYKWKMRNYYRYRIKHTFSNAERILTVSEDSRKNILHYSGRAMQDIISISPGPTLPLRDRTVKSSFPQKYILINGNIELRKNIIPTINAFLESGLDEYHLVIAGKRFCGDKYWNEFTQLVEQSDRIIYLGYIDNQELKLWYAHAAGIACCSIIEGFGIPALNARSMGKPCLISDNDALEEAAGGYAIKVNHHDLKDISNGFLELVKFRSKDEIEKSVSYAEKYKTYWNYFSAHLEEVIDQTVFASKQESRTFISTPALSPLKKSILETLAYSAVFQAPIQLSACYKELNYQCSYEDFTKALLELSNSYSDIIIEGNYVGLKSFIGTISKYCNAFEANQEFIKKHQSLIKIISKLPWVSELHFSGGTVHANHMKNQDVDLFVIAARNRVWLLYTLLKLVAAITRSKKLLCFNYLIDNDKLHISAQQDLYTAHQILHLKPVIEDLSHSDLKAANPWIYDFFPNSRPEKETSAGSQKVNENNRKNIILEILNLTVMMSWGWFWKRKGVQNRTGGIRWDAHQIKLHTNDHRPSVYKKYAEIQAAIFEDILHTNKLSDYDIAQCKECASNF